MNSEVCEKQIMKWNYFPFEIFFLKKYFHLKLFIILIIDKMVRHNVLVKGLKF